MSDELPPLPTPTKHFPDVNRNFVGFVYAYTDEQMQQYARDALASQAARIVELQQGLDESVSVNRDLSSDLVTELEKVARLTAECARLKLDAERWRKWHSMMCAMLDENNRSWEAMSYFVDDSDPDNSEMRAYNATDLTEYIDAARTATGEAS